MFLQLRQRKRNSFHSLTSSIYLEVVGNDLPSSLRVVGNALPPYWSMFFFSLFLLIFKMAIDSTHLLVLLLMSWSSNLTTQRLQHRYLSHLKELEIENINFLIFQRLRFGLVRFTQQFMAIQSVIYSLILMNVGKFCLELCKFLFHSVNVVSSSVEQMHRTTELLSSKGL